MPAARNPSRCQSASLFKGIPEIQPTGPRWRDSSPACTNKPPKATRQAVEAARQAAEAARLKASLQHAETKIQALTLEFAHLKRLRYGVKSEALSAERRDLFQDTQETDLATVAAETEQIASTPCKERGRVGRQPLSPHLPQIEIRHEPDTCTCGQCGQGLE